MVGEIDAGLLNPNFQPQFNNILASYNAGMQSAKERQVKNALALYQSNPDAGINAMTQADPETALKLRADYSARQKEAQRQAVFQLPVGPEMTAAAVKTADPETMRAAFEAVNGLSEQEAKHTHDVADAMGKIAYGALQHAPGDTPESLQTRRDIIQQEMPGLLAKHVPQPAIDALLQNPSAAKFQSVVSNAMTLQQAIEQTQKEMEAKKPISMAPGSHLMTPQGVDIGSVPEKPETPKYEKVTNPDGTTQFVLLNPNGQPQAQAQGAVSSRGAPTGKFDDFYDGFLKGEEGGYTPSDGNGAPANFGINQKANPDLNVAALTPASAKQTIHDRYWVPSGADKLAPGLAEIQADTAVNMGVAAAKQLLQQSGGDPQKYLQLRDQKYRAIAANDPSKAASLPTWLKRNGDLAQYVSAQGGAQSAPAGGPQVVWSNATPASAAANSGLSGDDYLKSLPVARAAQVKAMLDGRMAFPGSFALKTPYWQGMISDAAQVDPLFDATKFAAKTATRTAFGPKGKPGQNLVSLQTLIGHIGSLSDATQQLHNTDFGWANPTVNALKNLAGGVTGDNANQNAMGRVKTDTGAVASEMVTALRGGPGAEHDVQYWQKQFDPNLPPGVLKGNIAEAVKLIDSRIGPLRAEWQAAMGPEADPLLDLYPKAAAVFRKLGGDVPEASTAATTTVPANGGFKVLRVR